MLRLWVVSGGFDTLPFLLPGEEALLLLPWPAGNLLPWPAGNAGTLLALTAKE